MPDPEIPEVVVSLIHAVREDEGLREFLFKFERSPEASRRKAFERLAAELRASGENEIADALAALGDPQLYLAACAALRELEA